MKTCRNCGKELNGRQRVFCSRSCTNFWWNKERSKGLRSGKNCAYCGEEFEYQYSAKKYCSDTCKWKARWEAKKKSNPRGPKPGQTIWNETRKQKFKDQEGLCWICGEPIKDKYHGHHLFGGDDRSNYSKDVVVLHSNCHNQLHKVTVCTDGESWWVTGRIFDMMNEVKDMTMIEIRK